MRQTAESPREFGKAVKKRLLDLDMQQNELAEQLGIRPCNLSRMLSGNRSGKTYRSRIMRILRMENDVA